MRGISFARKSSFLALATALAIAGGAMAGCSGGNHDSVGGSAAGEAQQYSFAPEEVLPDLQREFESSSIVERGVVSSNYVNESPYEVTALDLLSNTDTPDGTEYEFTATIENDNFITDMTVNALQQDTRYTFDVVDSTTTPKKGVDYDNENGIMEATSVLAEDGTTCTVENIESYDYWFATVTKGGIYTYKFDKTGWLFDSTDAAEKTEYKDIEGTYIQPAGELVTYSDFKVSNLVPSTGAFHISFTQQEYVNSFKETMQKTSVELDAGIKPVDGSSEDGAMDDGIIYEFQDHGTTDKGDKTASMNGYLGVDKSGNKILYITDCSVDSILVTGVGDQNRITEISDWAMLKE